METWFDDIPVLAERPDWSEDKTLERGEKSLGGIFNKKPFQHSQHTFGYIPTSPDTIDTPLDIRSAGSIAPDETLKGARVTITLDRLMIQDYPGWGGRTILFDFYAQHQVDDQIQHLHFNQTYKAQKNELVGVIGFPIFVGLTVGEAGLAFKCFTVNVQNQADQAFLNILESPAIETGLQLTKTAQPAIAPLADIAFGLTKQLAQRNQNVAVQNFYLGLDFTPIATRARLREGSYVAVQTDETWDWSLWAYDPSMGRIGRKEDSMSHIPYNYIVFSISRYTG